MKPLISSRSAILSRIGDTLLFPGVVLKKLLVSLADSCMSCHALVNQFVQHNMSVWSVLLTIDLDHVIVPTRDRSASAKMLADLLGVSWAGAGPFSTVYVNESLTLDFVETEGAFAPHHYCFRVEEAEFSAILGRLKKAGIKYRSTARGADDMRVNRQAGGACNVYWNEPDGHQWEILTLSHATVRAEPLSC